MPEQPAKKIFLTGFMGAGKTTVSRYLARMLNCEVIDIDEQIVLHEGRPVKEIFAAEGETYFRNCETDYLRSLSECMTAVYATGGGIVMRESNRQIMRELGMIVYLSVGWDILQQRLKLSKDRPLAEHQKGWQPIKQLWLDRQEAYQDADFVVDAGSKPPQDVATVIYQKVREGLES